MLVTYNLDLAYYAPGLLDGLLDGLTFPVFDLAPKRNEKFRYCELDLV